jgi:DNA-binding transcriptional MerR regulator
MDMTRSDARLFTIGEFSRLARISVRMLRHYDDRGVLLPASVDASSGYRFYAPAQLRTAARICALRDAGFPVAEIGRLLPLLDRPPVVRQALVDQRARLEADAEDVRRRIETVDHLMSALKEPVVSIDIRRTTLPALAVASLRGTVPTYADEGLLWERLVAALGPAGVVPVPEPTSGATFHDEGFQEQDVDIEVWMAVAAPFDGRDGLQYREIAPRDVVTATMTGSYDQVGAVTAALGGWIAEHGLELDGPMFDIYRVGPAQDPDPARWVTEICLPVRAR